MITRVTGKNQITVPAEVAAREGIVPGTRFDWQFTEQEHVIMVRVIPAPGALAASLRGRGRQFRRRGSDPVANLHKEREREERERRGTAS
ncbi:MAG: hypothetical protein A3K19_18370 [Lentisphaerae bacterium RIFOXYB12_FULL_65_16]|nr:MAG: hypothetical protein A3K18_13915 [Lentisphaerae bacterium RIFOXYA12_64_32]OGV92928.1 MAG: hypothetical protein A3K19_18370 [Lentisphaerae bacterium RIFOXYB12_FULL_65_16]